MGGGSENSFVQPLGLLLGLTAVVALLLSRAKQSTIVAFIFVGASINAIVGNQNFDATILGHFSEVGILVLLFMAGLEVELHAFLKNWKAVVIVGVGQILCLSLFSIPLSLLILPAVGSKSDFTAQIYFALCMTFSSTILVLGYLKQSKSMETVYGQLCLGTLILQDVTSVLGIAVLGGLGGVGTCAAANSFNCTAVESWADCEMPGAAAGCAYQNATTILSTGAGSRRFLLAASSTSSGCSSSASPNTIPLDGCYDKCALLDLTSIDNNGDAGMSLCLSSFVTSSVDAVAACAFTEDGGGGIGVKILLLFVKLIIVCLFLALLNKFVLNKLFEMFAQSFELLYLGSLGYAFGLASLAIQFEFAGEGGFSPEITVFLAGVSIAQLPYKIAIESKMEPIKSLGVAMFFLSLGLQLNMDQNTLDAVPLALSLAFFNLLLTLPLFMFLGYTAKLKSHDIWMLGLLMNQISEFSLILCTLSVRAGVLSPIVLTTMTVAAIVSIILSSIGHIFVDDLYKVALRGLCARCFQVIDNHHRGAAFCACCCSNCNGATETANPAFGVNEKFEIVQLPPNAAKQDEDDFVVVDMKDHRQRDQIVCLGYNEMFPAVLSLADATNKEVLVVEYDPLKIKAIHKQYNEQKRNEKELVVSSSRNNSDTNKTSSSSGSNSSPLLRGVQCCYADIHDPECWEELNMDEAFMIFSTMRGARHAEKSLSNWLQKHHSHTIFVAMANSNVEAIKLYDHGAHFVMQTEAVACAFSRNLFLDTVANIGDCSQLVLAGRAHSRRLKNLERDDSLAFQYETVVQHVKLTQREIIQASLL